MSVANPLTAGSEISFAGLSRDGMLSAESVSEKKFGVFAADIVEISAIGRDKLQKVTQVEASREIDKIANEVVRISSSIGKAQSVGNLSHDQAAELYKEISLML